MDSLWRGLQFIGTVLSVLLVVRALEEPTLNIWKVSFFVLIAIYNLIGLFKNSFDDYN